MADEAEKKPSTLVEVTGDHAETALPLELRLLALCLPTPSLWFAEAKLEGAGELKASVKRNPRIVEDTDDIRPRKLSRGRRRTHSEAKIIGIAEDLLRRGIDDSEDAFFDRVGAELERLGIPVPGRTWMQEHLGPVYKTR
jgi:hypothetical protein